jgi:putative oxidoreductase
LAGLLGPVKRGEFQTDHYLLFSHQLWRKSSCNASQFWQKENLREISLYTGPHLARPTITVFGMNGFLHFIPMGAVPGLAGQYLGALAVSHYLSVVFGLQLVSGVLLLANRFVPLALTLLAPVIVNILLFHAFLAPAGLPMALIAVFLWIGAALPMRPTFAVLLQPRPPVR